MIDWHARAVERPAQHLGGDGHAQHVARELAVGVEIIDSGSALEDLKRVSGGALPARRLSCRRSRAPDLFSCFRRRGARSQSRRICARDKKSAGLLGEFNVV